MPIEIRELIIRAVVKDEQHTVQDTKTENHQLQDRQLIVEECVKQVLKILQRKQER